MLKYKVWNRQDTINGVSAEEVIKSLNIKESDEIFLILNGEIVTEIQFKHIIQSNLGFEGTLTCEEVAQKYIEYRILEEERAKLEIVTIEKQQEQIASLKEENEMQEEMISNITYELMQISEVSLVSRSIHSPKYEMIKRWFVKGFWTEDMISKALELNQLTKEEYEEIIKSK